MRFSKLLLENWRNFGRAEVSLQSRAFLVGPNASGKSNFLDIFRFLRDITAGSGFQQAVSNRGGISRIRNLAARYPSTDIILDVSLEDEQTWRYRIAFSQDNQRQPILKEEQVWQGDRQIINRPDDEDTRDAARLRQTHLEQTIANREFRLIADFFSSIRYYHIVPQLVRDPNRSIGRKADPYGGDLLEQLALTNKKTLDARLRRIGDALRIAVPQLRELKLEKDDRGVPHLFGNYEHWRPQGAWQTEADFSDGTLRLMGLLWALLDGMGPLLLEEPELSLHPEIVRHVPQMMRRAQRERKRAARQIFLSTHSSDLLRDQGIAADEILLVAPSPDGSTVQVGANIDEVRQLLAHGLTAADVIIPRTRPDHVEQLSLF